MLRNQQISPVPEDLGIMFDQEVSMYDSPIPNASLSSSYPEKVFPQPPSPQGLLPSFTETFASQDLPSELMSLYGPSYCSSWTFMHPENWTSREVCDILFFIAGTSHQNISQLRYKAFHGVTAAELRAMTLEEFERRDPLFGATLHLGIQALPVDEATFYAPDMDLFADMVSSFLPPRDQEVVACDSKVYDRLLPSQDDTSPFDGGENIPLTVRMGSNFYDIDTDFSNFGMPSLEKLQQELQNHHKNDERLDQHQTQQCLLSDSAYSSNSELEIDISDNEEELDSSSESYLADYRRVTAGTVDSLVSGMTPASPPHVRSDSFSSMSSMTTHSSSDSISSVSSSSSRSRSDSVSNVSSLTSHRSVDPLTNVFSSTPHSTSADSLTCVSTPDARLRFDSCSSVSSTPRSRSPLLSNTSSSENDDPMVKSFIKTDAGPVMETPRSNRGRRPGKGGHLWQFIRDTLNDPQYNPSLIRWEDKKLGVFRIMKSDRVAQMWGRHKENPTMTYEKLSRAMRYYYKKKILDRVEGKRLVYMFGPRAIGWNR